ncbi:MAG: 2OG-Fe dioxygenase family protein [Pseudomonadota bacterium]
MSAFAPEGTLPWVPLTGLATALTERGCAVVSATALCGALRTPPAALWAWNALWDDLPPDAYLRDGGRYRRRRHACFVVAGEQVECMPHRPHWQPVAYNALHGGLERWFEPLADSLVSQDLWAQLLTTLCATCSQVKGPQPWYVEAHQFRIDTTDGIGRPTPEGAHRDGVDFVAVILVSRQGIKGGETRVFEAEGPNGIRFTLSEPWTVLMMDDERVIHETTPIQPVEEVGHRDTLVLTFRRQGFQGPGATEPDDATPAP